MRAVCLYLHIHQPIRYREYSIFDVGNDSNYFYDNYNGRQSNERIFKKVAAKSYYPMLNLLLENMKKYPGFKISFSITGTWIEQAEKWEPKLLDIIREMVKREQVEIVGETYYHSLAYFYNIDEFNDQVRMHAPIVICFQDESSAANVVQSLLAGRKKRKKGHSCAVGAVVPP